MYRWLFTGMLLAPTLGDHLLINDFHEYQSGKYGVAPNQTYHSSNVTSPIFNYNTWNAEAVSSDPKECLFMTLDYAGAGPYIFRDDDLSLVYADPSFDYAMNARMQWYDGSPWLTFWHGAKNRGDSQGFCVFLDDHYQVVYNVTLGPPLVGHADMHECEVTFDGRLLLTAYQDKPYDLSSLGGKRVDALADSCFQQVNVDNNLVSFTWCASDHFSPALTYWNYSSTFDRRDVLISERERRARKSAATSTGFDAYHINSVQKTTDGNFLVSLRNLHSLVYVDGGSGKPIWILNGKKNEFSEGTSNNTYRASGGTGNALGFAWQHDARIWQDDTLTKVTLFDNHELSTETGCTDSSCSRAVELQIDTTNPRNLTVELTREYRSPSGVKSVIFGSMQALPVQHPTLFAPERYLIGWGVNAEFSEHSTNGSLLRDVQYSTLYPGHSVGGQGVQSSRIYKHEWVGKPKWPPSIAIDGEDDVCVSWNGATEVKSWRVYGAESAELLGAAVGWSREAGLNSMFDNIQVVEPLYSMSRTGFETRIQLGSKRPAYVRACALDKAGLYGCTETLALIGKGPSASRNTFSYMAFGALLL